MDYPTPHQIEEARHAAELSATSAAELVYANENEWQAWEAGETTMHPGLFELFLIKTGQINGA